MIGDKIGAGLVLFYGAAALAAQVIFLREFLVLAQGNELLLVLGLWAWLVWTGIGSLGGGRLASSRSISSSTLAWLLGGLGWFLPVTVFLTQALPGLIHLPLGQALSPMQAGWMFLGLLAPFCILSGLFFPLACQCLGGVQTWGVVGLVYFLDTLGAALGVGFLQLLLIGRYPGLEIALGLGFGLILPSIIPFKDQRGRLSIRHSKGRWAFAGLSLLVLGVALVQVSELEKLSRRWQWPGQTLIAVQESPYGLLSATQDANQVSFFSNNLWYFSYPDPLTAEESVQYALLQHPHPRRVLLIGGGVAGAVAEILKTPGLTALDYVELDPRLISLVQKVLPPAAVQALQDPRVRLIHQDGRRFIKKASGRYDVILLCLPEPKNALLNRFYTREFFQAVKLRLRPTGVFSFGLTGSETSLSPLRAQYLALAYHTLKQVFPEVKVFPGLTGRFFASPTAEGLVTDPAILVSRLQARRLKLLYVREYYLFHNLSPARQAYLQQILAQAGPGVNSDLCPQCYFYDLALSGAQEGLILKDLLLWLRPLPFWLLPAGVGIFTLLLWLFWRRPWKNGISRGSGHHPGPYLYNVLIMGLGAIALEVTIIILFQIQLGFLYSQLGLLMAAFMFGMGVGSFLTPRLISSPRGAWRLSLALQGGLALFAGLLGLGMPEFLRFPLVSWEGWAQASFVLLQASVGFLGGGVFASQAELLQQTGTRLAVSAGLLYAVDLLGATLGTLGMSLIALPLWGLRPTMLLLATLHLSALVILALSRRPTSPPAGIRVSGPY